MDEIERAGLARRWWRALAADSDVPLPAEHGHRLLSGFVDELVRCLHAESFDPSPAGRVGAALVRARFDAARVPVVSARVLAALGDGDEGDDAGARLAALFAAFAQGHQAELCRADHGDEPADRAPARTDDALYRVLFDNAAVGIAVADTDGVVLEANRSLGAMIGVPAERMRGHSVYEFAQPGEGAQIRTRVYDELIPGKIGSVLLDRCLAHGDGSVRWLSFAITHVESADGHPDYLLAFGGDDTERRLLQQELHHQARHDPLTGLPNRRQLLERMEQLIVDADDTDRVGLCFADLDHFKDVNDRYGHGIGDKILTVVAARLREIARERDCLIARIGGDEFVALIPPPVDPDGVRATADRLLSQVTTPIVLDGRELRVSASIGAVVTPVAGADAESVLEAADTSLYSAKTGDKGHCVLRTLHTAPGHTPLGDRADTGANGHRSDRGS